MATINRARLLAVVVLTIVVDALTKLAAVATLADGRVIDLGLLDLRLVYNEGVAFSLGSSLPAGAVIAFTGLMMAGFSYFAWRGQLGGALPAGLIVGGGVGNLIDRIARGSVVDMFDTGFWPVFNIADIALTVGIGILILTAFGEDDVEDVGDDGTDEESREAVTVAPPA